MDQVKQEIKEWEKAKTEYQEIVIQMQNKGIFLGIDSVPIFLGSVPAMPELVCKLKSVTKLKLVLRLYSFKSSSPISFIRSKNNNKIAGK